MEILLHSNCDEFGNILKLKKFYDTGEEIVLVFEGISEVHDLEAFNVSWNDKVGILGQLLFGLMEANKLGIGVLGVGQDSVVKNLKGQYKLFDLNFLEFFKGKKNVQFEELPGMKKERLKEEKEYLKQFKDLYPMPEFWDREVGVGLKSNSWCFGILLLKFGMKSNCLNFYWGVIQAGNMRELVQRVKQNSNYRRSFTNLVFKLLKKNHEERLEVFEIVNQMMFTDMVINKFSLKKTMQSCALNFSEFFVQQSQQDQTFSKSQQDQTNENSKKAENQQNSFLSPPTSTKPVHSNTKNRTRSRKNRTGSFNQSRKKSEGDKRGRFSSDKKKKFGRFLDVEETTACRKLSGHLMSISVDHKHNSVREANSARKSNLDGSEDNSLSFSLHEFSRQKSMDRAVLRPTSRSDVQGGNFGGSGRFGGEEDEEEEGGEKSFFSKVLEFFGCAEMK